MLLQPRRAVALLAIAPHLGGCLERTIVGAEAEGGGGSGSAISTSFAAVVTVGASGGGGGEASATAWLGAELAGLGVPHTCAIDCAHDADMLYLLVDSQGGTCAEPFVDDTTTSGWELAIRVPPAHQEVGVHVIDDSFDVSHVGHRSAPSTGATVGVGGGGLGGTLEILELTEATVRFTLAGLHLGDTSMEGVEHVAPRCGSATLPPEGVVLPGHALADAGGGGGGGGAAAEEGETVTVVVGSELVTCAEPLGSGCDAGGWQLAVSLPTDYLAEGSYSLADPRIDVLGCDPDASPAGGTMTLFAIDDASLVARFAGVGDLEAELAHDLRIERCP